MTENNGVCCYKIILDVKGPVHIGDGVQLSKKECLYLSNERKIYVPDSMKLFEGIKKLGLLNEYQKYLMDREQRNLMVFARNHNISPAEYKSWSAYTLPMNDITDVENSRSKGGGSDNINTFVKDKFGCPYIPGSSLKGALRTVIQNAWCADRREAFKDIVSAIDTEYFKGKKKYLYFSEKQLSERLFNHLKRNEKNKSNAVNDIFAGIRISDSKPLDISDLVLCQKIERRTDGSDAALPIRRECIKPGTKVEFDLEIDRRMFDIDGREIVELARKVYEAYRRDFLSAFKGSDIYNGESGESIYLGGGAGYATKTSVYALYSDRDRAVRAVQNIMVNTTSTAKQHDPHKHLNDAKKYRVSPHIRKCTRYLGKIYDMGVCDISIE